MADLVPARGQLGNRIRMPFGCHSRDVERGSDFEFGQDGKDPGEAGTEPVRTLRATREAMLVACAAVRQAGGSVDIDRDRELC
jgi:hypothetical protein